MVNAKIREFENDIINFINASGDIPVEVKHLVLRDICNQLEKEADKQVVAERQMEQKKKSEESHE
jgi:hypothetical protein